MAVDGMDPIESARAGLGRLARTALDVVLPPQCLSCKSVVAEPGAVCAACWSRMRFIAPPQCACCGIPFENIAPPEGTLCGACLAERPGFVRARAAFRYDEGGRGLILAFKHGDRTDAAPAYARWLLRAGGELVADADLIAPVPLHWTRLFARRYNQAALLAEAVGRLANKPVIPDMLLRRRRTPSQGRMSRAERLRNVRGAFAVANRCRHGLKGRRVLLVDDVMTTGATIEAAVAALLRAGAGAVDALTLARVVRAD
jgi:ComF family protein